MKAIQLHEFGGADAFQYVDLEDPTPGEGEVLIEIHGEAGTRVQARLPEAGVSRFQQFLAG